MAVKQVPLDFLHSVYVRKYLAQQSCNFFRIGPYKQYKQLIESGQNLNLKFVVNFVGIRRISLVIGLARKKVQQSCSSHVIFSVDS